MLKVYEEVNTLDKRCYDKFFLSEDLLMEQAASSMYSYINKKFKKNKTILIVCGTGNNAADGLALARMLYTKYDVKLYIPYELKSSMAILQEKRVKALGLKIVSYASSCDILVDCLFGTGLNKPLDDTRKTLIDKLNRLKAFKIACDIPSGINIKGQIKSKAFIADITITMGALKSSLYSDAAKDYVGKVIVSNLGIQREMYEIEDNNIFLLEKKDMKLPFRKKNNTHKGLFGHLSVIVGEKEGAGIIAGNAAFSFGAGLVSVITHKELSLPNHLMQSHKLPLNTTAIALGMGLGNFEKNEIKNILSKKVKKIIDADMFYEEMILNVLKDDVVLTPHPKEFVSLLKLSKIYDININELQENRFKYIYEFSKQYPKVTILLKGSNTLIAKDGKILINRFGTPSLSKGGSGDVLSGLIASLLAQNYSSFEAAYVASLAHAIAASKYKKNNYSLSPQDIIDEVKKL
ncbi:MAG: NAD(P)H-hydrate dehydratase [Campylobacteraceae bacterium]|nr:NAD(P)H-hydrate dehydratase [Campylobacteraceae bacterium]